MADGLSRAEVTGALDRIERTMQAGFTGMHERLDRINGRVRETEIAQATVEQRVVSLEKELFARPRRVEGESSPRVTKRDGAILALGLGVVMAAMKLLTVVGVFVLEVGKAALKVK